MGLDMYLRANKYISAYEFSGAPSKEIYQAVVKAIGAEEIASPDTPTATVDVNIGYWRKANHIHAWFVDHCGDGVDEGQEIYVSKENLEALEAACNEALAGKVTAERVLPTRSGFFFGSTEYDESYKQDTIHTLKVIEAAKKAIAGGFQINYAASW